jgi:hypothetical protein
VFISMKKNSSGRSPDTMNSTVPAPRYPTLRAASTAAAPIAARRAASSRGEGASSMIFWCRRWMLHSRSPRCSTVPCVSASTWISMCRGRSTNRSASSVSSPNAASASRRAPASASGSSSAERTSRMPFPPPPADGLISTGNPTPASAAVSSSSEIPGAPAPGTTGTLAAATAALARILSPMIAIAEAEGPMNATRALAHACANPAFSDRNPYPGCTASEPVCRTAAMIRSTRR